VVSTVSFLKLEPVRSQVPPLGALNVATSPGARLATLSVKAMVAAGSLTEMSSPGPRNALAAIDTEDAAATVTGAVSEVDLLSEQPAPTLPVDPVSTTACERAPLITRTPAPIVSGPVPPSATTDFVRMTAYVVADLGVVDRHGPVCHQLDAVGDYCWPATSLAPDSHVALDGVTVAP
jgi:hypothetical protein